jgi:hypothetical protein
MALDNRVPSPGMTLRGKFFTTACDKKRLIPSPAMGEGQGGGEG